jgi:branched-chain amino acid transport system permease protein
MDSSVPSAASVSRRAAAAPARRAPPRHGGLALLALVVLALPLFARNDYVLDVAILVALNAIVCVGLNLLVGYAGQISLGHAGFFGLGAYGSALLAARYGWPPLLALATATSGVALLAFVVGRPILRLKGHYLAMATLGLGIIVAIVIATEDGITGGPDGMAVPPLTLAGFALQGERTWYWIAGGCLVGAVWLATNLIASPTGRALRALHGSEIAAQLAGIDSARHKLTAFVVSAVFAAFAGGLAAFYAGFVTPAKASFLHSIELVTMVVFGGMASTFGAVVGAAVLTVLPQLLTSLKDYEMVVFGALLMATMIFFPRGVVPTLAALWRRWRPLPPALAPVYRGEPAQARDSNAARPASHPLTPAGAGRGEGLAPASGAGSLHIESLSRRFGGLQAIAELSFDIRPGTVHSIIGPNGAGKTTLLNLLTGVYAPSSGRIVFDGVDLTGAPPHRWAAAGIGRTFQNLQIFFNMTALENVMTGRHRLERGSLVAALLHTPRLARIERESRERALEWLRFLDLGDYADSPADALPYGALKRLEIARALAGEPSLLLLDEPAAGLNPTEALEIDALIKRVAAAGTTVVLVEHNMRLVMGVSDHILVLDHGKRLAEGTAEAVRHDPRVIEAYLGAGAAAPAAAAETVDA